ncbi:MAG: hypothetical protein AAGG46_10990, partial [Planctomycetota bacterium]
MASIMFQWRWKLRQAKQAVDDGRYGEASRLLADPQLSEFLPAKRLADQLAARLASRAGRRIAAGQSAAGFADLGLAENVADRKTKVAEAKHDYAERVVADVVSRIEAGSYAAAREEIARAGRRGVGCSSLRLLGEIADFGDSSNHAADRGEMSSAEASLDQAVRLLDSSRQNVIATRQADWRAQVHAALQRQAAALADRAERHAAARERMHLAVAASDWGEALSSVEEAVRLAPNDQQAAGVRRRAWKQLGLEATRSYHGGKYAALKTRPARGRAIADAVGRALRHSTHHHPQSEEDTVSGRPPVERRMLWIDSVGGLLVCLDDEVVLGQPAGDPARGPAVPILADLSRRHAVVRREAGRYVLDPLGKVMVDGREATETTVLPDRCLIEL